MAEKLKMVLNALILQADRQPGTARTATLDRGLILRVTRSVQTGNYKLECGRKKVYASPLELTIVMANWPAKTLEMEWHPVTCAFKDETHWVWGIVKPVTVGAPA